MKIQFHHAVRIVLAFALLAILSGCLVPARGATPVPGVSCEALGKIAFGSALGALEGIPQSQFQARADTIVVPVSRKIVKDTIAYAYEAVQIESPQTVRQEVVEVCMRTLNKHTGKIHVHF